MARLLRKGRGKGVDKNYVPRLPVREIIMSANTINLRLLQAISGDMLSRDDTSQNLADAFYVISAISRAGLVIVPKEPTSEMLSAGSQAGDISIPTAYKVWRAMTGATE